jgi:hypothetical protein
MALARDPRGGPVAINQLDVQRKLNDDLRELVERLSTMVEAYQEKPSAIDTDVIDSTIRAVITDIYCTMKSSVYADDSPLRAEREVWDAFQEQQDEFIDFYKSAQRALEAYKEVLQFYNLVMGQARVQPQLGDLQRIRQDKHAHVEERDECIEAVSDFYGKFCAMLTVILTNL